MILLRLIEILNDSNFLWQCKSIFCTYWKNFLQHNDYKASIYLSIYHIRLKNSYADQDTLMECDQTGFIFKHTLPIGHRTSSIDIKIIGTHWLKSHEQHIWRHHMNFWTKELFIPPSPFSLSLSIYIYIWDEYDKFPDFFAQAFKIQYVIAIHLMRWLANFYDFRFKWTATAATGIHLLKPDCHGWWILKMQSNTLEERYALKFCFKLGKNTTETYGMLQTAFGGILHESSISFWVA